MTPSAIGSSCSAVVDCECWTPNSGNESLKNERSVHFNGSALRPALPAWKIADAECWAIVPSRALSLT